MVIALVDHCRSLRRPWFGAMSKISVGLQDWASGKLGDRCPTHILFLFRPPKPDSSPSEKSPKSLFLGEGSHEARNVDLGLSGFFAGCMSRGPFVQKNFPEDVFLGRQQKVFE